jgi:hypothetical protein
VEKFVKTHVGHQMDLGKIPLTKLERNKLATKISQKIFFDDIVTVKIAGAGGEAGPENARVLLHHCANT